MSLKGIKVRDLFILLGILVLAFAYQNCGNISLAPLTKLDGPSCDPSIYNIAREAQTVNGQTVYFVQQNNRDISNEYRGTIQWTVNGVIQTLNITHDNRLLLNCETHPEEVEITAKLMTDCETEIEIFHSDKAPNTCEETPEPSTPPGPGPELTYCEEYKRDNPGVEDIPGFNIEQYGFHAIDMNFEDAFVGDYRNGSGFSVPSFENFMLTPPNASNQTILGPPGGQQHTFFKAPLRGEVTTDGGIVNQGMRMKYIAIPLKIPESSPYNQLTLTGAEQFAGTVVGSARMSISPCKGDFRFRDRDGIGQSQKASPYCTGITYPGNAGATPVLTLGFAPSESWPCYIPKGKTVWLNVAFYTFANPSNPALPDFAGGEESYFCGDRSPGLSNNDATCGFWTPDITARTLP